MYMGTIKSRIFSLIHHLRQDSLDASYAHRNAHGKLLGTLLRPLSWVFWSIELLTSPFYAFYGESLGFPMIIITLHDFWQGSSHTKWVIQSAAFLPRHTHMHAHESQNIPQIPHSLSSFWRGNILHVLVALYSGIHFVWSLFTFILTVSVIVSFAPRVLYFCMLTPSIIGLLVF